MTYRLALLAGLPLLALATPAAAQSVSASSYKTTLAFADCAIAANPSDTTALLASAPASLAADTLGETIAATPGCTGKPNPQALRGAIAERVYLKTFTTVPAEPTGPAAPFAGSGNPALALWDVTRCTALRDPVGSDMLVRSEVGSAAQKDAFRRLGPVIGACVPAGIQLNFDREQLRGLIAEGLLATRTAGAQ